MEVNISFYVLSSYIYIVPNILEKSIQFQYIKYAVYMNNIIRVYIKYI